ncbi:MAG: cadherin-like beta sandwich domain-containing protein [Parabacteroides gordonii]|uniref:cadherin-like beta sandwich domain-containing protein n=1 Tax=Parabacteroides gordonii TaxID=574930 RepID=UPI003A8C6496
MKRVNLLSTDQSSSGSKMTTIGQANHTGSTRTKAAKGLFSHFMFLASLLLITLLTSGKALAQTSYNVTLADAEGCGLTVSPNTTDGNTKEFTLSVQETSTHKLPTEGVKVSINGAEKTLGDATNGFTYSNGVITIGSGVTIDGAVEITAAAVEKSTKVDLTSLTYSITALSIANKTIELIEGQYEYTVDLGAYLADGEAITLEAIGDADDFPKITTNEGVQSYAGLTSNATITVTSESGEPQVYTITFTSKDKLTKVSEITVGQLSSRYTEAAAVAAALQNSNPNATITSAKTTVNSLPITWSYSEDDNDSHGYNAAGGETNNFRWELALGELVNPAPAVEITGTVEVANVNANTSTDLSTFTYTVPQGEATAVDELDLNKAEYNIELSYKTALNAEITVNVASTDYATAKVGQGEPAKAFTVTLEGGTGSLELIITAEDGIQNRTVTINFTVGAKPASTDASISKLFYQIEDGEVVDINAPKEANDGTNDVTVPFNTTLVKVSVTPKDKEATVALTEEEAPSSVNDLPTEEVVTPTTFDVPITGATTVFKFTITAEDGVTKKNFSITFTVDDEKITEVTVPATYKLPEVAADIEAVKLLLAKMEGITIKTNGNTDLKLEWSYDTADNGDDQHTEGAFSNAGGATNVFTWTVNSALEVTGEAVKTGKTTVTNQKVVTGETPTVEISAQNPVDKIGDGGTTTTEIETVTVSAGTSAKQLTIDNATVSNTLALNESIGEIILNKATIKDITLATSKETTLTLQSGNQIEKITNAGTLTLQDAEAAPAVATQSMAIGTRAALANNGAVGTVENNGVFTDKTATIVIVDGDADLSITSQPTSKSTTGSEVTLSVGTTSVKGDLSYQWQMYSANSWSNISSNGTEKDLKITKSANGTTQYRCEVKSTNKGEPAKTTTLYTQAASVQFYTSTPDEPSNPSTPTYTVSLDKVAGATFSKGEKTTVDAGDSFSFKITLDKDYDQSKPVVTVDGKAITADADGSYTIKNIQTDIKIVVSGIVKNTATGIEDTVEDAARAWTVGSTLYIHVPETSDVYVVSGTGALLQQLRGVSGDYNMQLRAGFYIVRIGEVSQKVIIR